MKILLLGGSGFIGSHLADRLVTAGHEVTIFHPHGADIANIAHLLPDLCVIEGDFYHRGDLERALVNAQVVVHLVNSTLPGSSLADPAYDIQSNVIGSVRLLDRCVKAGVEKVVFLSSGGTVYGIPRYTPIDEAHPLDPIAPYGISKLMIEKYLAMYRYHYGLDYVILRLSNPYGPRQDPHRGQGVLAAWMHRALTGAPVEIWGDGSVVRDYIYIEDAVHAIELAATRATADKVFNVGSGVGQSLTDLHEKLESVIARPLTVDYKTIQRVDVPVNVLDITHFSEAMQWRPMIGIDQGIVRMWDAFNAK